MLWRGCFCGGLQRIADRTFRSFVYYRKNKLVLAATDSYRLAEKEFEIKEEDGRRKR